MYETSSGKVGAYRSRQESAGYLRREVLVTQTTADRLGTLAKEHGVSATDVASAMLEHGLAHFDAQSAVPRLPEALFAAPQGVMASAAFSEMPGRAQAMSSPSLLGTMSSRSALRAGSAQGAVSAQTASGSATPSSAPNDDAEDNPILRFFARRKESLHEK